MRTLGIIPARYASTRFPGKPLALIKGKPMIQWTYERALQALDELVVATDDVRIQNAVKNFNGNVVMTSSAHQSGTDRCAEALSCISDTYDLVINIQGDEPLIEAKQLEELKSCFLDMDTDIATLVKSIELKEELNDPNIVKVVFNKKSFALYFSRSLIPFPRNKTVKSLRSEEQVYYKHIGIYAFRAEALKKVSSLEQTSLELMESLEQLRWLENGFNIKIFKTGFNNIGVDTPSDLEKINQMLPGH